MSATGDVASRKSTASLALARCVEALQANGARRATVYMAADLTVKATRQRRPDRRSRSETFVCTIGRPNYAEREFLRQCRKAGEPLPVKKVQLQSWPQRRGA